MIKSAFFHRVAHFLPSGITHPDPRRQQEIPQASADSISTPHHQQNHQLAPQLTMNVAPRLARSSARAASSQWSCFFCQNARPKLQRNAFNFARNASNNARTGQPYTPTMDEIRAHYSKKNRTVAYYVLSTILGFVTLTYGSVPLYKMICQTTGWGGQPIRAHGGPGSGDEGDLASRLVPVKDAKRIKVTFSASVSDVLPWKFVPQQREVRVLPGETALAFYKATNKSDQDIIGVATYSVTPAQCAPYFSKIQCFCFEEQRLNAGETVDMPVFFYLDPDLLNDMNMKGVETVTLSYTFFKARYDNNGRFQRPMSA